MMASSITSPLLNKTFRVICPFNLSDSRFYFSKDGWLVLYHEISEDEAEVILANPITNTLHKFPGLPSKCMYNGIAFFGCPPNDCVIFAITSFSNVVLIDVWDKKGWQFLQLNNQQFIRAPFASPVVYHDSFICLGEEGNIGVYNYHEDMWATSLVIPRHFGVTYEVQERCLVESEGEILVVLIGKCNPPIEILRLDQQGLSWERVAILGSQTLFLGPQVSILANLSMKRMENIVFRSRFLKLPEEIEAKLRICDGRMFFVPKYSSCCNLEEGRKGSTKGRICTYSLQSGRYSRYHGSEKYIFSIWYKPRLQEDHAQALPNMRTS